MIKVRSSQSRGHTKLDWLETFHTFAFASYRSWLHRRFRSLRVLNEDIVQPERGFDTHFHADVEIMAYALEGGMEHKDDLGNTGVIRPGEVQLISAGSGLSHSEHNRSKDEAARTLQIWILPREKGLRPGREQRSFPAEGKRGKLRLIASPDGLEGSLTIHQDAKIYDCALPAGESVVHELAKGRHAWIQAARGSLLVNGVSLAQGDGAAVSKEKILHISAPAPAEFLLIDLA